MLRAAILLLALACAPTPLLCPNVAQAEAASEQRIPFKRGEETGGGMALRVIGGFALVVFVGIAAVYLLKRYLPVGYRSTSAGAAHLRVIEAHRLTPRVTLFLVELDGARLLLGQSGDRITRLYEEPKASSSERRVDG